MNPKLEFKLEVSGLEEIKTQAEKIKNLSNELLLAIEEINKMEVSIKTTS